MVECSNVSRHQKVDVESAIVATKCHYLMALVLDGKRFAADTMVIAMGITLHGEKVLLGFVQTGTEHADVCARFLRHLVDRGLRVADGLLAGTEPCLS